MLDFMPGSGEWTIAWAMVSIVTLCWAAGKNRNAFHWFIASLYLFCIPLLILFFLPKLEGHKHLIDWGDINFFAYGNAAFLIGSLADSITTIRFMARNSIYAEANVWAESLMHEYGVIFGLYIHTVIIASIFIFINWLFCKLLRQFYFSTIMFIMYFYQLHAAIHNTMCYNAGF